MPEANQDTFTVDVVGEISEKQFTGKFTVKKRLSFRDQLARDNIRRSFLGPTPGPAYARAVDLSEMFSETSVRIVDAP